jgi:hypothetical protein
MCINFTDIQGAYQPFSKRSPKAVYLIKHLANDIHDIAENLHNNPLKVT